MWHRVKVSDPLARAMRDRHYSTKYPGGRTVGPPGRRLVLISDDEQALWITHWPQAHLVLDGFDALRCTVFRREGRRRERASVLIRAAMAMSEAYFGPAPDGWLTYVEPRRVKSSEPGYSFKMAGFSLDEDFRSPRLIRLVAAPLTAASCEHVPCAGAATLWWNGRAMCEAHANAAHTDDVSHGRLHCPWHGRACLALPAEATRNSDYVMRRDGVGRHSRGWKQLALWA